MKQYTCEELKGLQEKSLVMAKYFVEFCEKNELLCYFCGGGCIGTVRHHGFIPWDDDLDFFMPRDDYEKLAQIWESKADTSKYKISKSSNMGIDRNLFITIRDEFTTQIKPYQKDLDIPHGVPLDILPLDGYPNRKYQRILQCFWAYVYSLYCSQIIPSNHGKLVRLLAKILLAIVPSDKIRYIIWKKAEKEMSKYSIKNNDYITELCSGPYYLKKKYPKEIFVDSILKDFEKEKMPIPKGYDKYLNIAFGDYMKIPPKDKQKPHHDTYFLDLNNTYKKYKGIYYCMEGKK